MDETRHAGPRTYCIVILAKWLPGLLLVDALAGPFTQGHHLSAVKEGRDGWQRSIQENGAGGEMGGLIKGLGFLKNRGQLRRGQHGEQGQGRGPEQPHHNPINFHHQVPTPSQITRLTTEIRNPMRHQSPCRT